MPKLLKKRTSTSPTMPVPPATASQTVTIGSNTKKPNSVSKQSRVISMLQSPGGTTIAAMMKVTGWQQHSVRGFLAGVVRKRLKLKLASEKVSGNRVYRISGGESGKSRLRLSKHRSL